MDANTSLEPESLSRIPCLCPPRLHCDADERHPACVTCEECDSPNPATCLGTAPAEDHLALALSAMQDIEDARRELSRLLFYLPEPAKTALWVLVNGPLKDTAPAGLSILAGA